MKLQINVDEKIIKIEDKVNLGELYTQLKKMFPDGLWKEFALETQTVINWTTSPIIIDYTKPCIQPYCNPDPIYPNQPNYPWYTWYGNGIGVVNNCNTVSDRLKSGVYNVEITSSFKM